MKKINRSILLVVFLATAFLCPFSYTGTGQTHTQSTKLASNGKLGENETKKNSILIYGRVVKLSTEKTVNIKGREIKLSGDMDVVDSVFIKYNRQLIGTALVKNGKFRLNVPKTMANNQPYLMLKSKYPGSGDYFLPSVFKVFVVEGDSVYILVDKNTDDIHVTAGIQNRARDIYTWEKEVLSQKKDDLKDKKTKGVIDQETYSKEMELLTAGIKKQKIQFITNHPYSFCALEVLHDLVKKYLGIPWKDEPAGNELQEYEKLFFTLKKPVQEKGQHILNMLQNTQTKKVPSFTGEMPDGKIFDLADLKGKVVLIDFWGSWCGWCRKTHPHLKELYAKYKDQGFEIVGVGVEIFGKTREKKWTKFRNAIADDGITWPQILVDRQKRDLPKEYGVSYYPSKFLVDRDGRLLLRTGSDSEHLIDAKLKELFNEANKSSAKSQEIYEADMSLLNKEHGELFKKVAETLKDSGASDERKHAAINEFNKLEDKMLKTHTDFVSKHPESPYSLSILKNSSSFFIKRGDSAFRMLNVLYNGLSEDVRASEDTGKWFDLGTFIRNYANTSVGEKFDPFSFTDNNGQKIDLADLKGKVILLDFWGSWCVWCRKAHPYLKKLYTKYKDQGLEIVGIARENGSKKVQIKQWKKAIEKDGIPWLNALNDPDERDLVKEYSIRSYPSKVLINKEGVIVSRSPDYQVLEEKIKELLIQ